MTLISSINPKSRRGQLFISFAVFAIFIACLGLFGLVTYAAEQRMKEIGIRKVLGAKVGGIVGLLSRDFIKLVLIASLIAFPHCLVGHAPVVAKFRLPDRHQLVDIRPGRRHRNPDRFADSQRTDDPRSHRKSHQKPEIRIKTGHIFR
jgi:hypothetical protein